ncbi:molybdopterin-guanine dinucleotide biosynthesis protein MobD [Escherichia coli]
MKTVIETTELFGDLTIEKRGNVYVLTQEDDGITILPMELDKILTLNPPGHASVINIGAGGLQVCFYRAESGANIETEDMCLSIDNWKMFVAKVKEFLDFETPKKAKLPWAIGRSAHIINPVAPNYATVLNVNPCYEEGDVVTIRQIDDLRQHIITLDKDEAVALKAYLDSIIPTLK